MADPKATQVTGTNEPSAQEDKKKPTGKATGMEDWLMQRDGLMLRMQHADEKLARRKERLDALEKENRQLTATLASDRESNAEVCQFYKKQLAEKTREAMELEERLVGIEQAQENKRQDLVQELEMAKAAHAREMAASKAEAEKLKEEVGRLEEWRDRAEVHAQEMAMMRKSVEEERKEFKEVVAGLEKQNSAVKDEAERRKEEELGRIRQAMFAGAYEKLDEVTKAVVAENDRLSKELTRYTKQAESLIRENKKLKEALQDVRRKADMLEGLERESAKKTLANKQAVKSLEEQLRQRDEELSVLRGTATPQVEPPPVEKEAVATTERRQSRPVTGVDAGAAARVKELESELASTRKANERYRGELTAAEAAREEARKVKEDMQALLEQHDQATWFLLAALDDARKEAGVGAGEGGSGELAESSKDDRQKIIKFFLGKLYTYKLAATEGIIRGAMPSTATTLPPIRQGSAGFDQITPSSESTAMYMQFAAPMAQPLTSTAAATSVAQQQQQPPGSPAGTSKSPSSRATMSSGKDQHTR